MKIHFQTNRGKSTAQAVEVSLTAEAKRLGLDCVTSGADADIVIVLGGDGTILRAVHEHLGVPVLGLNLGGLGYLSSVEERDFAKALEMLADGRYRLSSRSALEVRKEGSDLPPALALNEIAVMRAMSGHAAILDLAVDGRAATRFMADGLIVATPTGSTAYSLAAGGPVLMPDSASFVVTPMTPHALGARPLVVKDDSAFTITSRSRANEESGPVGVYADGQNVFMLADDESLKVTKAARGIPLVELEGFDPYEVLARKLGWRGSMVK